MKGLSGHKHTSVCSLVWRKALAAIGIICCSSLFLLALPALAQDETRVPFSNLELPLQSAGSLPFFVDVIQLQGNNHNTSLELQYAIDLQDIVPAGDAIDSLQFTVQIKFLDMQSQLIHASETKQAVALGGAEDRRAAPTFVDLKRFTIDADTLHLRMTISDSKTGKSGVINHLVAVNKYDETKLSLSDPVFLSHVRKDGGQSVFARHGLLMVPNPARLYRPADSVAKAIVYFEINNLTYSEQSPSLYALNYTITDLTGREVTTHEQSMLQVSNRNISRLEKISFAGMATGVYRLNVQVIDRTSNTEVRTRRYFRVITGKEGEGPLLPMGDADVRKYYDQIKYLATNEEKKLFMSLDAHGKQVFLLHFWKSRDTVPETPENEFMQEYFSRIAHCEDNFTHGINSDRGRVYLTYGPPMDIRRIVASGPYNKPVEIWVYAIEGTSEFVFVDRIGGDQFVLVHSTHPDEVHNPDWSEILQ